MRFPQRPTILALAGLALLGFPGAGPAPRVAAVWPAGPLELRVAFDRPVDPALAAGAIGRKIALEDRRATLDPDPEPVGEHRGALNIVAGRLSDEGRTLVLTTDPHARVATYTLELPGVKAAGEPGPGEPVALHYDLTGASAQWSEGDAPEWSGWWPALDLTATRQATRGSAEHERALALLDRPGKLVLSALILPKGKRTLLISAGVPFEALLSGDQQTSEPDGGGLHRIAFAQDWTGELLDLTIEARTRASKEPLALRVAFGDDARAASQPLPRALQLVPWAPPLPAVPGPPPRAPDLSRGDRARGEAVFFGETAKCSTCHTIHGQGGKVGPDLSTQYLRQRDRVFRDIAEPSAVIHPDFVPYTVALKDGRIVAGLVRADDADTLRITTTDAKTLTVPRAEVEELRPSATSIMPVGLVGAIGEDKARDVLTFLMSQPPKP